MEKLLCERTAQPVLEVLTPARPPRSLLQGERAAGSPELLGDGAGTTWSLWMQPGSIVEALPPRCVKHPEQMQSDRKGVSAQGQHRGAGGDNQSLFLPAQCLPKTPQRLTEVRGAAKRECPVSPRPVPSPSGTMSSALLCPALLHGLVASWAL